MVNWHLCRIGRSYKFSAAHFLPHVADNHKCKRVHGHNYVVEVEIRGELSDSTSSPGAGFCAGIDFFDVDSHIQPLVDELDHRMLNDIPGLENPTAENIAKWFMDHTTRKDFFSVKVWEEQNCWAQVINADGLYKSGHKE